MGKKGGFNTQKIFKFVRIGALALPAIATAMNPSLTPHQKLRTAAMDYFGVNIDNGSFNFGSLAKGWGPFVGATVVTYGIPKLTSILRSF